MDERDRKDRRYVVALPVTIISRNADVTAVTEDVSLRGIFLRMKNPPKTLQLLRMKMTLEPNGTEITVLGVGRHVIDPGGGHATGVGIEFFGLEGAPRTAWEAFVHHIQSKPMPIPKPIPKPPPMPGLKPPPPKPPPLKISAKPILRRPEPDEIVLDEMDLRSIPPDRLRM